MRSLQLILVIFCLAYSMPAWSILKIGNRHWSSSVEAPVQEADDYTVTQVFTRDPLEATITLIFKDLFADMVKTEGQVETEELPEYDLTTGTDLASSKVNLNLSITKTIGDKSITWSTDEQSTIEEGKLTFKYLNVRPCEDQYGLEYVTKYTITINNLLKRTQNLEDETFTEQRVNKVISGRFSENLPNGFCFSGD